MEPIHKIINLKGTMMIKYILKTSALIFLLVISNACQDDVNNNVPPANKKLSAFQQDFKNFIIRNSIATNKKIWVSNRLRYARGGRYWSRLHATYYNRFVNSSLPRSERKNGWDNYIDQYFFIGFDFSKNNDAGIYPTLRVDLQTKSSGSDLYNSMNVYNAIYGDLRIDLKFEHGGVLANLKRKSAVDFEYRITEYANDKIKMKPYFTQTLNPEITLIPYDFDTFKIFKKASEIIYGTGGTYGSELVGLWDAATVSIKDNSTKKVIDTDTTYNFDVFPNFLIQDYYKEKEMFVFRVSQDLPKELVEAFKRRRVLTCFPFFYDSNRDIKYLVPISATDNEIVFETYGENKASDKKYTVTFTKK